MKCKCGGKMRVKDSGRCGAAVYRKRVCERCRDVIYTEETKMNNIEHGRYMLNKARNVNKGV